MSEPVKADKPGKYQVVHLWIECSLEGMQFCDDVYRDCSTCAIAQVHEKGAEKP